MVETLNAVLDYERFKCCWCQNLLSVGPILNLDEKNFFCGRCNDKVNNFASNPAIKRQKFYEKLAKNCQFPCRYKDDGCEEILRWGNVQEHENNCKCREMDCLFTDCEWSGDNQDIWKHVDEVHPMKPVEIQLLDIWREPKSQIFKLELGRRTFLGILVFIENIYYLLLFGNNEEPPIEYKIEISDDTRKNSFIYSNLSKNFPSPIDKIIQCGTKLEFNDIIPKYLTVYFGHISRCRIAECHPNVNLPICENVQCRRSPILPIYTCDKLHRICKYCFTVKNLRKCPECQTDIEKNYAATVQYLHKHYQCDYFNCFFHGNIFEMVFHQRVCKCSIMILDEGLDISKFNIPYAITFPHVHLFETYDRVFFLSVSNNPKGYFNFQLNSWRFSNIVYKFHITFHSAEDSVLTFPIAHLFRGVSEYFPEDHIRVPETLFGDKSEFTFSLNFSIT